MRRLRSTPPRPRLVRWPIHATLFVVPRNIRPNRPGTQIRRTALPSQRSRFLANRPKRRGRPRNGRRRRHTRPTVPIRIVRHHERALTTVHSRPPPGRRKPGTPPMRRLRIDGRNGDRAKRRRRPTSEGMNSRIRHDRCTCLQSTRRSRRTPAREAPSLPSGRQIKRCSKGYRRVIYGPPVKVSRQKVLGERRRCNLVLP